MVDVEKYSGWGTTTSMVAHWNSVTRQWEVEHILIQKRLQIDNKDWEEKEVSIKATAPTIERALSQTSLSIMKYMENVQGDLFKDADNLLNETIKTEE